MFAYSINQTNPGNKRTCILKGHFNAYNKLEGRQLHREKVYLAWIKTTENNYEIIIKWTKFMNEW